MSRRRFLQLLGGSALATACGPALPHRPTTASAGPPDVRAVAFDLFTIFDPRGIDRRVAEIVPDDPHFAAAWKTRLFEYSWIRTASGRYVDFAQLVHDALIFASRAEGISLERSQQQALEAAFTELPPWPDSLEVLRSLRAHGLRLAPLANFSPKMIEALLGHSDMRHLFEAIISTDRARTYKPDPRAYALGEAVLELERGQIAFAAFGGWDAAGARWYGYPTFWVNRLGVASEELTTPDATGPDLRHLARWLSVAADGVPSSEG